MATLDQRAAELASTAHLLSPVADKFAAPDLCLDQAGYSQQATPPACHFATPAAPHTADSQHSIATQQYTSHVQPDHCSHSSYAQVTKHLAQQHDPYSTPRPGQPASNMDVINQQMASMALGMPAASPAFVAASAAQLEADTLIRAEPATPYSLFNTPRGLKHTIFSSQPSWRSQQPAAAAMVMQEPSPGVFTGIARFSFTFAPQGLIAGPT